MEITGRLTGDAAVKAVNGDRKVVNFSIAINDTYRSGGETKKVTTFFECSYWLNTGITEYLKKGGWVQLYGRIGINPYISGSGEAKASLTFHTSEVKLLGGNVGNLGNASKRETASKAENTEMAQISPTDKFDGIDGDLPF